MAPDRSRERGFILATTLLVMTLLTVMLTAVFITVSAEFRSTGSSFSTGRSQNLAQEGLYMYFASSHALGTGYDSTNYAFPGGYARVVARKLRDTTGTERELWIVYSTGVDTTRSLLQVGGGSRAVASLAYRPGQVPARAAMVAANGVTVTASGGVLSNPLNGHNARIGSFWVLGCTDPSGALGDTAAITTPRRDTVNYPYRAGYSPLSGTLPSGTLDTVYANITPVTDSTRIDWARVVAGDLTPDYTNTLPAPCPAWLPAGDSYHCPYSSYYWNSSVTVGSAGFGASRGLLIATGNVTMAPGSHWDGIIIAGGQFIATVSNYVVHGMVISGMNCATGSCPAPNTIQRGGTIQWDWCYAHAALSGFASLAPISGTFMDTWKTY